MFRGYVKLPGNLYFLEMIKIDEHIFQIGWNHHLKKHCGNKTENGWESYWFWVQTKSHTARFFVFLQQFSTLEFRPLDLPKKNKTSANFSKDMQGSSSKPPHLSLMIQLWKRCVFARNHAPAKLQASHGSCHVRKLGRRKKPQLLAAGHPWNDGHFLKPAIL